MAQRRSWVKLAFPIEAYQPDALRHGYTERELRKEYSRLRTQAQKRLQRIAASEFSGSQTYLYNKDRYKKTREILDVSELTHLLTDLHRFLTAQRGSLSGLRESRDRAVETWRENGYSFVNKGNYNAWTEFLEYAKDRVGHMYRLESIARIFKERYVDKGRSMATVKQTFMRYYNRYENNQS